jgi:taurine dioxygenase
MTAYERITVSPIAGALGAEIGSVDIAAGVDDATIAEIRRALLEHLVIFFRDQQLDDASHKAFSRRFGELFIHPNYDFGQAEREIVRVVRAPGDERIVGEEWHTDTTMMREPPMGSILYALEVPPYGGDTLFANQYLAYESLSEGMKTMLAGLKVVHSDIRVAGPQAGLNARRSSKVREDANTAIGPSSPAGFAGKPARSRSGTIVAPSTWPSTMRVHSTGRCNAHRLPAGRSLRSSDPASSAGDGWRRPPGR